ncbi:MAG TPA: MBL fold metallo-hydrolase [Gammaproteobacteria bacterium]|nr:MBL fold metallo-hydrolase [Gammaproteobacteria bacterium]
MRLDVRLSGLLFLSTFAAAHALAQSRPPATGGGPPRTPPREITQIAPDLYRANNGNWYTIFLVTDAGILLGDPISVDFAAWLKGELDTRFKGKPVRYVVYSHSHFDHAEGGRAFASTATFVAHENMLRNMDGRYPQMPGDMVDRNANGVIDPDEIAIPTNTRPGVCGMSNNWFATRDYDGDGKIPPQELQRDIVRPSVVYSERMRIEIGGKVVELVHPGLNHSDDATVMLFPAQRVLFATEFLADALVTTDIHSLPSACGPFDGSPLAEWIKSYRTVEALDFDVVAPGHGAVFPKSGVTETREYFEDLVAAVSAGMAAGQSLEQLKDSVKLEKYSDWKFYDRLRTYNVEAAYRNLQLYH